MAIADQRLCLSAADSFRSSASRSLATSIIYAIPVCNHLHFARDTVLIGGTCQLGCGVILFALEQI